MSEKNDNLHAGHRQRVRKRFIEHGSEGFEPHEILEMVLFYAIPRKDTNLLAHKLLERYGTFAKVCDAPVDVLQRDFGLTESAAVLLKMLPPLSSVYVSSHNDAEYIDRKVAVELLQSRFIGATTEKVALALSDAKDRLIFCDIVIEGSLTSTELPLRRIVELAMRSNARYAYMAHNHPSGLCVPSKADIAATRRASETLWSLGIMLVDHIIFTSTEYYSIRSYAHSYNVFVK